MPASASKGYAFNRTRQACLADDVALADTHWSRLRGLMGRDADSFRSGTGLWIVPCHGVHTMGMRFPIDAVYLDQDKTVVHVEENLRPWRVAPVRLKASSVLELPTSTVSQTRTALGDKIEITFREDGAKS